MVHIAICLTILYDRATMTFTPDTIVVGLLVAILLIFLAWIVRLEIKVRRLLLGKNGRSLEDTILFAKKELEQHGIWRNQIEQYLGQVERRLSRMVHEAKTIRFNAFKGTGEGGNQSFATALLSEEGNGVVISSVFTRDRVSVYAKPIENRTSSFDLTEEERLAIEQASSAAHTIKQQKS